MYYCPPEIDLNNNEAIRDFQSVHAGIPIKETLNNPRLFDARFESPVTTTRFHR